MFEKMDVGVDKTADGESGITVRRFVSDEYGLVCPYFHQRYITADMRYLVCEGRFPDGRAAVRVNMQTGAAYRLTEGDSGIHLADLDVATERLYFTRDGRLCSVDIETGDEAGHRPLPEDEGYDCASSVHLNSDGSLIALWGNREHASGVKTGRVWTVSTDTLQVRRVIDRPFQIGHVQFSPTDPNLIMYCHETGGASPQRVWLARTDGDHPGAVFDDPGHPWVTHETFSGNGEWVVFIRNPEGVGMIRTDNSKLRRLQAAGAWHPGPNEDANRIVYDTHGKDIKLLVRGSGERLLIAEDEMADGGPHPHPRFAPDDGSVVWTGSRTRHPHPAVAAVEALIQ